MSKRAFTLIEMVVATSIFVVVFGIAAVLYVHAATRMSQAYATNSALWQVRDLDKYLENTIQNANTCTAVSRGLPLLSATALQCTMPSTVATTDLYGVGYTYSPINTSGANLKWGKGNRRWFFFSDSTGNYSNSGSYLWMAEKSSGSSPITSDTITNWTYYNGDTANYRWNLIDNFSFSVNSSNNTVTYSIGSSYLIPGGTTLGSGNVEQSRSSSITRTVYWRHSVT